jgi:hypothetical protein
LRRLADERVRDAGALLRARRWAGAYYLAGYAVECGLKACIVAYVRKNADVVFRKRKYSDNCWTHDIEALVALAGLGPQRSNDLNSRPRLAAKWQVIKDWSESDRYKLRTRPEAEKLYEAVTDAEDGVLPWIRNHW